MLTVAVGVTLEQALDTLRASRDELRRRGVLHASVFGSMVRGESKPESDLDVLVELDPSREIGLFEYSRLKLDIAGLFPGPVDVVNRDTVRPLLRDSILGEAIDAF